MKKTRKSQRSYDIAANVFLADSVGNPYTTKVAGIVKSSADELVARTEISNDIGMNLKTNGRCEVVFTKFNVTTQRPTKWEVVGSNRRFR